MKKFIFPLKKMRDYKRQMKEREKNYLLSLYSEYNELEARYNELNDEIRALCLSSDNDMRVGISVREIQIYEMKKEAVRREQSQLRIQMDVLDSLIEKQRKVVVKISQEVSGLDKLEENQKSEYLYLLDRENERVIEEFLSFKLIKNKEDVYALNIKE